MEITNWGGGEWMGGRRSEEGNLLIRVLSEGNFIVFPRWKGKSCRLFIVFRKFIWRLRPISLILDATQRLFLLPDLTYFLLLWKSASLLLPPNFPLSIKSPTNRSRHAINSDKNLKISRNDSLPSIYAMFTHSSHSFYRSAKRNKGNVSQNRLPISAAMAD
jgi:hypothetical protein